MKNFRQEFTVNCNIDRVWAFYTDIQHLQIITPKFIDLEIINTTHNKISLNQQVWIKGKINHIKRQWHSKITYFEKYRYDDEMQSGPFKKWKHIHLFQKVNDDLTRITDIIEFELPYGLLGRMLEGYAYKQLKKIFEHRKNSTITNLEK